MGDDSNDMPVSRVVRWLTLGALILFAIALYFRDGLQLPSLGPVAPAATDAAAAAAAATPSTTSR
jgi:hypothetical protein